MSTTEDKQIEKIYSNSRVKWIVWNQATARALENVFLKVAFLKFVMWIFCQNSWKIPTQEIIFSKVSGYQPTGLRNLYFFLRIVPGFTSSQNTTISTIFSGK